VLFLIPVCVLVFKLLFVFFSYLLLCCLSYLNSVIMSVQCCLLDGVGHGIRIVEWTWTLLWWDKGQPFWSGCWSTVVCQWCGKILCKIMNLNNVYTLYLLASFKLTDNMPTFYSNNAVNAQPYTGWNQLIHTSTVAPPNDSNYVN
jgi:hypothetical protein